MKNNWITKILGIVVLGLLLSGNAFAENENFFNKYLSFNELYIKNPKNNFFYGSFKINSDKIKNIKFYYAGRQETKDGQFYVFYLDEEEPNFLISENAEFFIKEYDQTQSFAPKSVSIQDFNNDVIYELALNGINWGSNEEQLFQKIYFFSKKNEIKISNIIDFKRIRKLYYPPTQWNVVIPLNFKSDNNYTQLKQILDDNGLHWDAIRINEFKNQKLSSSKFKIIFVDDYLKNERKNFFSDTKIKSLVIKLLKDIYGDKVICNYDSKYECVIDTL